MKNNIDVMIACGRNSESFVKFLIHTIERTTSKHTSFNFLLGVNDDFVNFNKLESIETKYNKKIYDCRSSGNFSYGHGEALDILFKKVETDLCLVADCDIAFLEKDWDLLLIDSLNSDDTSAIIGNEYEINAPKYGNFPNLVMSLFKTEIIRKCGISWMPGPASLRSNLRIDESNHEIFSKNIGDVIDPDTGWELCFKLKSNGYKGIGLPLHRKSSNDFCKFLKEGTRGEEHWLGDKVICTHVGRSFTRPLESDVGLTWLKNVLEHLDRQDAHG